MSCLTKMAPSLKGCLLVSIGLHKNSMKDGMAYCGLNLDNLSLILKKCKAIFKNMQMRTFFELLVHDHSAFFPLIKIKYIIIRSINLLFLQFGVRFVPKETRSFTLLDFVQVTQLSNRGLISIKSPCFNPFEIKIK